MTNQEIMLALAEPFDPEEVKWKPQAIKGNRCLAVAFVDARCVMDRLDDVMGVDGWQDDYEFLPDGSVVCRLRLRFGSDWITKTDIGGQSEQPDEGDRHKAAVSDALKRAAVKWGISRYIYRLPHNWVDYDEKTRRILRPPTLPEEALPYAMRKKTPAPTAPAKIEEKKITSEQWSQVQAVLKENGGDQSLILQEFVVKEPKYIPAAHFETIMHRARAGAYKTVKADPVRLANLRDVGKKLGLTEDGLVDEVRGSYPIKRLDDLTVAQADDCFRRLNESLKTLEKPRK